MSLINDALKKAQKQRTGDAPDLSAMPSIGGEPAARIAKRAKPLGFSSLMMWIGVGAGTLIVLVVGGFFFIRWMIAPPPAPAKPTAVAAQMAPPPVAETVAEKPAVGNSGSNFVLPAAPAPAPAVAPAAVVENKPLVVTPVEPPVTVSDAPKPVAGPLKLAPKAVAYIEGLHVAGIRASATDSKVLMNDRVYRVDDIVEHQLGLKLAAITSNSLTFEDERGARYTRNF